MAIPGTVTVTSSIAPTSTGDTYPTTDATYGLDGLRNVVDNATRNNIPTDRRRQGMVVGVNDTGATKTIYWTLLPEPWTGTDSDWTLFNSGSGAGSEITGGTLSGDTLILNNSTGGTINVNGFVSANTFTTGATLIGSTAYFDRNDILSAYTLDLSSFSGDSNTYVTGGTLNYLTGNLILDRNDNISVTITGLTDIFTTGATFDGTTIAFDRNDILSAYTVSLSGLNCMAKYSITTGLTSGVTVTINHNFNTSDIIIQVIDVSTNELIYVDVENYLLNSVDIISSVTLPSVRVVILACGSPQIGSADTYTTSANLVGDTIYFNRNDTLSAYSVTLNTDIYVTGGTYNAGTATFTNNTGGTFNVTGFTTGSTDTYITGLTFNNSNYDLTATRNDGFTATTSLAILASDMTVTGGTYNPSTGTATFTNNSGGTFNVTGFLTGFTDTYVTGGTYNNPTGTLTLNKSTGGTVTITGFTTGSTDTYVTGGTFTAGTTTFTNNTGGTFSVTGYSTSSKYSITTGFTANVTLTIPHNLNDTMISVTLWDNVTGELIYGTVDNRVSNSVDVTFTTTLSSVDVVVIK